MESASRNADVCFLATTSASAVPACSLVLLVTSRAPSAALTQSAHKIVASPVIDALSLASTSANTRCARASATKSATEIRARSLAKRNSTAAMSASASVARSVQRTVENRVA